MTINVHKMSEIKRQWPSSLVNDYDLDRPLQKHRHTIWTKWGRIRTKFVFSQAYTVHIVCIIKKFQALSNIVNRDRFSILLHNVNENYDVLVGL